MIIKAMCDLKRHKELLTPQQFRTLKGQILAGDIAGYEKGIQKILRRVKA